MYLCLIKILFALCISCWLHILPEFSFVCLIDWLTDWLVPLKLLLQLPFLLLFYLFIFFFAHCATETKSWKRFAFFAVGPKYFNIVYGIPLNIRQPPNGRRVFSLCTGALTAVIEVSLCGQSWVELKCTSWGHDYHYYTLFAQLSFKLLTKRIEWGSLSLM